MTTDSKERRNKFMVVRLTESEMSLVKEFKQSRPNINVSSIVRRLILKMAEDCIAQ